MNKKYSTILCGSKNKIVQGFSVLLPVSRKSVIGRVLGIENPADRDAGTVACIVAGMLRGASIFRVHNVSAAWFTIRAVEALR